MELNVGVAFINLVRYMYGLQKYLNRQSVAGDLPSAEGYELSVRYVSRYMYNVHVHTCIYHVHDLINEPQLPRLLTAIYHTGLDVENESHPVRSIHEINHNSLGCKRPYYITQA